MKDIKYIVCTSGMSDFFTELLRDGNPFGGNAYHIQRLVCGSLAFWAVLMLRNRINERQLELYKTQNNNEYIFKLAVGYCRAMRGVEGYSIDRRKIVHGPDLELNSALKSGQKESIMAEY